MKAVVAAFNQEKALVGAFSVMTNLRMQLFEALFPGLSFEWLLGWVFYPLALVMGVPCGSRCPDLDTDCSLPQHEDECKLVWCWLQAP